MRSHNPNSSTHCRVRFASTLFCFLKKPRFGVVFPLKTNVPVNRPANGRCAIPVHRVTAEVVTGPGLGAPLSSRRRPVV